MRQKIDDPKQLQILVKAIRGEPPGPGLEEQVIATRTAVCPYKGLRAFREEDADFFFGRDGPAERLAAMVQKRTLVAVVGASGSGKSSMVFAGLVPRLRHFRPPEPVWIAASFTPSDRPYHQLASALLPLLEPGMTESDRLMEVAKLSSALAKGSVRLRDVVERIQEKHLGADRLLIVVDQFEELYTLTADKITRHRFIDHLLEITKAPGSFCSIVLTLRGDFYGKVLSHRPLADALQDSVLNLGPMTREELKQVVLEPARKVDLHFEPGLVERILNDVGNEPSKLPLLEFALTELWNRRRGNMLTHEAYDNIGQVQGAIAKRAEAAYNNLKQEAQKISRRIFVQLVKPGEGTEDTRRRARLEELVPSEADRETVHRVIKSLADARLVVTDRNELTGEETVELVHEALIWSWDRLKKWIDEDRAFRIWQERLRVSVRVWEEKGRDEGVLLRGALLSEAERWLKERREDLSVQEREFIQESIASRERERIALKRKRRRILISIACGLVIVLSLSSFLLIQRRRAEELRRLALARELATLSQVVFDNTGQGLVQSVLLAVESLRQVSSAAATHVLRQGLSLLPRQIIRIKHAGPIYAVSFSSTSERVATAGKDGTARVWDVRTGEEISRMVHNGEVLDVEFSPDGRLVASASIDGNTRIWEAETGEIITTLPYYTSTAEVIFGPDGELLATMSQDGTIHIWEVSTGKQLIRMMHEANAYVYSIVFSPDGKFLASGGADGTARIWEVATGKEIARFAHKGFVTKVLFSPDGKWIATASLDGTARVWDVTTGNEIARMVHAREIQDIAFSPNGEMVVSASEDGTAFVWEANAKNGIEWEIQKERISAVALGFDAQLGAMADEEGIVWVWDLTSGKDIARIDIGEPVYNIVLSPNGKMLITKNHDGMVSVWDLTSGRKLQKLGSLSDVILFSPNGKLIVRAVDNVIYFRESSTWRVVCAKRCNANISAAAFSTDGSLIAVATTDGTVRVWEMTEKGKEVARMAHDGSVKAVAFSPNGKWLASAGTDGTVRIWEVLTGEEVVRLHHSQGKFVSFTPDGEWVVSASLDIMTRVGTIRGWLWRPKDLIAEACNRLPRNLTWEEWQRFIKNAPYHPVCPNLPLIEKAHN